MPTIAQFYGILIRMFYEDHAPPHFHAIYGEHELIVRISPPDIINGEAPGRVRAMVLEWAALHERELIDNWARCRQSQKPLPIQPLE